MRITEARRVPPETVMHDLEQFELARPRLIPVLERRARVLLGVGMVLREVGIYTGIFCVLAVAGLLLAFAFDLTHWLFRVVAWTQLCSAGALAGAGVYSLGTVVDRLGLACRKRAEDLQAQHAALMECGELLNPHGKH